MVITSIKDNLRDFILTNKDSFCDTVGPLKLTKQEKIDYYRYILDHEKFFGMSMERINKNKKLKKKWDLFFIKETLRARLMSD